MEHLGILILTVVLILIVLVFVIGYALASYLVHPQRVSLEDAIVNETSKGYFGDYGALTKQDYIVKGYQDYELHVQYIPARSESKKFVIISHGYTYNRLGSVKYLRIFRDFDYNCIIYDDRAHGLNKNTTCTMGIREAKDLLAIIQDAYDRYGNDIYLGLHGESMGSGLTAMALRYQPNVKFAVLDCGYADIANVLQHKVQSMFHLPPAICYPASLMCKLFYGYFFGEVQPIKCLKNNQIPVCFMHGEEDTFVSCANSERMYEANKGYKELHLFPGAEHAEAYRSDPERYREILKEFLENITKRDE